MLKIYNTLSRKVEEFKSIKKGKAGMYTCGPTVYDYDHLGHAWNYFNSDILRRVLEYEGYEVKHVLNITDVGHLTSDADTGDDKLEKAARAGGKTAREIADYFTDVYFANRKKLNFLQPDVICKATDYIKEMIELVQTLLDKGYGYETSDGIYFDTSKFPRYGQLSGNTLDKLKEGARVEINPEKKNPSDFAIWKFSPAGERRQMEWEAFGRKGFPGWHIECSAMSMKHLGQTFDIHTGGEDNIFPHHECEIAQSESASGAKFVDYWFHTRFLMIEGEKMSKSKNNFYRLQDLEAKGYSALDLRYLFLTAHYRSQLNFTWAGIEGAKVARAKLMNFVAGVKETGKANSDFKNKFLELLNDDLALPQVMALVWEVIKSDLSDGDKKATLLDFDKVLGLDLAQAATEEVPEEIQIIAEKRWQAKKAKDFTQADKLRKEIEAAGYAMEDGKEGYKLKKM